MNKDAVNSGDSDELEALFNSIVQAHQASNETPAAVEAAPAVEVKPEAKPEIKAPEAPVAETKVEAPAAPVAEASAAAPATPPPRSRGAWDLESRMPVALPSWRPSSPPT